MSEVRYRPKSATFSLGTSTDSSTNVASTTAVPERPGIKTRSYTGSNDPSSPTTPRTRLRRSISSLQGEPRGDATGPALATAYNNPAQQASGTSTTSSSTTDLQRPRRSRRRRVKSLFKRWKSISLRHTWLNPLIVLLAIIATYLINPSENNPVSAGIFLSYPVPLSAEQKAAGATQMYLKGRRDFAFVAFYTIFFSFTREFVMQKGLRPLAQYLGIMSRGKQARFMEQGYTALYFAIAGPFGLYVMSRTTIWYFRTESFYEEAPHHELDAQFKAYYLLQASYWAQQAIVLLLLLEKPRKDFKELVAHHVVTLSLIGSSYRFHLTYIGLAVYITHDISDFFLATSKLLNYLDSPIVIPYFVVFLFSWIYLRHYQNLRILNSMIPIPSPFPVSFNENLETGLNSLIVSFSKLFPSAYHFLTTNPTAVAIIKKASFISLTDPRPPSQFATLGPYYLDAAAEQFKCSKVQWLAFSLLSILQAVNLFWCFLILRILWRLAVSWGEAPKDDRSEATEEEVDGREMPEVDEEEVRRKREIVAETRRALGVGGEGEGRDALKTPEMRLNGEVVG